MPVSLAWSNSAVTVLGCRLGNDYQVDWLFLLARFDGQLILWKHRRLSFRGCALVANLLGLPLFWYQATIFDIPKVIIPQLNKILFGFIQQKKREWLVRSSVTLPLASGGLRVVNVAQKLSSLRAVWIRRYLAPPHSS